MGVILHVQPGIPPLSWEEFRRTASPFSIALDGYVAGGPMFDPHGPRVNFNHHEDVSRLETRATCGQVLMAIRQGLFECFRDTSGTRAEVWVNDCDEDVCTAWFLLKYGYLAEYVMNPLLNRLVALEDALDTTAGAYPFPKDLTVLRELAWVYEPYRRFRMSGRLERKNSDEYLGVITDVEHRIMRHITGHGGEISLDTRYERIGGGHGWTMIKVIGAHGRTGAFADGIRAYVDVRERGEGIFTYTMGRMSPYIKFDLDAFVTRFNEMEGCTIDCWGGGDTIKGSPRVSGSKLLPEVIERNINEIIVA